MKLLYYRIGIDVFKCVKVSLPLPPETLRRLIGLKKWTAVLEEDKHWTVELQGDMVSK